MAKGQDTKLAILDAGLEMASRLGLESITIGSLAKATRMSKSGLFAHFQSKENLQIQILEYAGELFVQQVVIPALRHTSGIPRIKDLVRNWNHFCDQLCGGCIFVTASTEFSERPGKVRDFILHQQQAWVDSLRRIAESAIKAGDFRSDIDCEQFAFDLYSLLLGSFYYHQLLQNMDAKHRQEISLEQLINNYR
jgi:AcrR family transcriptional regulator